MYYTLRNISFHESSLATFKIYGLQYILVGLLCRILYTVCKYAVVVTLAYSQFLFCTAVLYISCRCMQDMSNGFARQSEEAHSNYSLIVRLQVKNTVQSILTIQKLFKNVDESMFLISWAILLLHSHDDRKCPRRIQGQVGLRQPRGVVGEVAVDLAWQFAVGSHAPGHQEVIGGLHWYTDGAEQLMWIIAR